MATTVDAVLKATSLAPALTVDDLQKSMRFFDALGFAVEDRWEHEGQLMGVMLRAGGARIGLSQDDWKKGRDRQKGIGMRIFIGVGNAQDVDAVAQRAKAAGITLDREPHDTEWQSRALEVTEPSGFKITISTE